MIVYLSLIDSAKQQLIATDINTTYVVYKVLIAEIWP